MAETTFFQFLGWEMCWQFKLSAIASRELQLSHQGFPPRSANCATAISLCEAIRCPNRFPLEALKPALVAFEPSLSGLPVFVDPNVTAYWSVEPRVHFPFPSVSMGPSHQPMGQVLGHLFCHYVRVLLGKLHKPNRT